MRSWSFREGDSIAPGRNALGLLCGGHRYEGPLSTREVTRILLQQVAYTEQLCLEPQSLV
jgi:hypothetical protein